MMKTVSAEIKTRYLSRRARVLLGDLQEACQRVLKLLAQLETLGLTEIAAGGYPDTGRRTIRHQ